MLKIVTINSWKGEGAYRQRLERIVRGIKEIGPHLVSVQECIAAPELHYDTAAHLAQALGYAPITLPLRSKPRDIDGHVVASTSGQALLARVGTWRNVRPIPLRGDPRDGERAALAADLELPRGRVTVVGVHLTNLPGCDELRRQQLDTIIGTIDTAPTAILAGDFNASIDTLAPAFGRFVDTRTQLGLPEQPTLFGERGCIDHVLFSRDGALKAQAWSTALDRADTAGSDHCAVVAELAWR